MEKDNFIRISGIIGSTRLISPKLLVCTLNTDQGKFEVKFFAQNTSALWPRIKTGYPILVTGRLTVSHFIRHNIDRTCLDIVAQKVKFNVLEDINEVFLHGTINEGLKSTYFNGNQDVIVQTSLGIVDYRNELHSFPLWSFNDTARKMLNFKQGDDVLVNGVLDKNVIENGEDEFLSYTYVLVTNINPAEISVPRSEQWEGVGRL